MIEKNTFSLLTANFGQFGGQFSWASIDEIRTWINQMRTDWQWLNQQPMQPQSSALNKINNSLNDCLSDINNAEQHTGNEPQVDVFKRNAVANLERLFGKYPWLLPNSTYREFIFNVRDSGRLIEAGLVTAYLLDQDLNGAPAAKLIPALVEFELFERGVKDRSKTEATSLRRLAGEITTALDEHKQLNESQVIEFNLLNQKIENLNSKQASEFEASQEARRLEWEAKLEDSEAELKRLNDTYDTHMAIAAPVSYWETKRCTHKKWAIGSFVALSICMLAFGIFLTFEVQGISAMVEETRAAAIAAIEKGQTKPVTAAPASIVSLLDVLASWKIGAYILLVTLIFWFIRLLVRIFLSNIHLENDAAERVTMAKTYLALMRDGSLEGKEHLGTILAALFRPTGDGIVKDEGLPPTAMEWLTKLSGKG